MRKPNPKNSGYKRTLEFEYEYEENGKFFFVEGSFVWVTYWVDLDTPRIDEHIDIERVVELLANGTEAVYSTKRFEIAHGKKFREWASEKCADDSCAQLEG